MCACVCMCVDEEIEVVVDLPSITVRTGEQTLQFHCSALTTSEAVVEQPVVCACVCLCVCCKEIEVIVDPPSIK